MRVGNSTFLPAIKAGYRDLDLIGHFGIVGSNLSALVNVTFREYSAQARRFAVQVPHIVGAREARPSAADSRRLERRWRRRLRRITRPGRDATAELRCYGRRLAHALMAAVVGVLRHCMTLGCRARLDAVV